VDKRRYGQFCGVAFALDLVGERWSLLIVRDLVLGPRRFKDLLDGLPGIATNLLAQRLKEMEANDLVERVTLPPPAASTVYQLTAKGEALEPAIMTLGRWGAQYGRSKPGDFYLPSSFFVSCRASFNPDRAKDMHLEFQVEGHTFEVTVDGTTCITKERAVRDPEAVIEAARVETLIDLRRHRLTSDEALRSGKVKILSGDKRALHRFVDVFGWRNLGTTAPVPTPRKSNSLAAR